MWQLNFLIQKVLDFKSNRKWTLILILTNKAMKKEKRFMLKYKHNNGQPCQQNLVNKSNFQSLIPSGC